MTLPLAKACEHRLFENELAWVQTDGICLLGLGYLSFKQYKLQDMATGSTTRYQMKDIDDCLTDEILGRHRMVNK